MNNNLGFRGKLAVGILALAAYLIGLASSLTAPAIQKQLGGAVGFDVRYATSTLSSVPAAGTVATLRATSSCAMRIITTKASPILLTFSDESPVPTKATLQAASTTVEYSSEKYGCGAVKAITGDSAASLVTLVETN